jgi:spore maturation protein CgeB
MDPISSYDQEIRYKTELVDYFCCDKHNVLLEAAKINKKSIQICEGYDETVDKPHVLEKKYDVSFIGNVYGNRQHLLESIDHNVNVFSGVYGAEHAKIVSKSWINLNFCTTDGASDRVYKIMAAGGFLLTDDWKGREKYFVNNEDLMIYSSMQDLNNKISKCLKNKMILNKISQSGKKKVSEFSRLNWAKKVVNFCYES